MAEQRPLVIIGGQLQQLPAGDTVVGVTPGGAVGYVEPVVVSGFNASVMHTDPAYGVPLFVTTSDGDIVVAEAA